MTIQESLWAIGIMSAIYILGFVIGIRLLKWGVQTLARWAGLR
jgi:hypothetical protein